MGYRTYLWKEIHVYLYMLKWWTIIFGIHVNFRGCDIPQNIAPARRPGTKRKAYTHYIANSWSPTRKKNLRMLVGTNPLKWCWKKAVSLMDTGVIDFFFRLAWLVFLGGSNNSLRSKCQAKWGKLRSSFLKNREPPLRNPRKFAPKGFGWIVDSKDFCCHDFRGLVSSFLCEKPEGKNPVGPGGIWQEPH